MTVFERMPLFVQLTMISGATMMVPAMHALAVNDLPTARAFFYSGLIVMVIAGFVAIAVSRPDTQGQHGIKVEREGRNLLLSLMAAYTLLPAVLALPFSESVRDTTYANAWWEMVSSLTTTGGTLFGEPDRLSNSVHLWRAMVGWMGGLLAWVTAISILAPMNLGGFEVVSLQEPGQETSGGPVRRVADPKQRLSRYTSRLAPVYIGLTAALWLALSMSGSQPFVALCHAMSVMATSGISPVEGSIGAGSGFVGEVLIFAFLFLALSRKTFTQDQPASVSVPLRRDPEMRLGLLIVITLPTLLFVRHWIGAIEVDESSNLAAGISALWGGFFMVLSFLTTAGFESASWDEARMWSGLAAPGILLAGLAIFGGGVATTAGGVKLLRIYALVRHGEREMEKLVSPNSVGGAGSVARRIRRQGAYVSWVFFMFFAISVSVIMIALSLTGLHFEEATVMALAALTTTGPLVDVAAEVPFSFADQNGPAKVILAGAMVMGRLEFLALIALLNRDFWRR